MEGNVLKILWLNANPNPNPGGTEQHSIDFINYLENIKDIELYKVVGKGSFVDKNTTDKNKVYISLKSEFSPLSTFKLINLAKKLKPDFIFGNNGNEYINTFLAGKISGAKIILFRHMLNYQPFFNRKFILPHVDKIFAVSEASKRRLLKDGIKEEKITVLPNFIDETKFYYDQEEKLKIKEHLGISKDEKVITFIGKVDKGKGIFDFVEIANYLSQKYSNLKFLIIGDGRDLEKAKSMIKNKEKFIITGFTDKPYYYLKASDFVLVLSRNEESFGRTVIEGFSVKGLVIVYDVENLKYLVKDSINGFVVENGNTKEAISKIELLLSDKEKYTKIVEEGYKEFKTNFTKDKIIGKFLKELKNLSS